MKNQYHMHRKYASYISILLLLLLPLLTTLSATKPTLQPKNVDDEKDSVETTTFVSNNQSAKPVIALLPANDVQNNLPNEPEKNREAFRMHHLLQTTCRILWEGDLTMVHTNKEQKTYTVITDDDVLYIFKKKPDLTAETLPLLQTIDLHQYTFITTTPAQTIRIAKNPNDINDTLEYKTEQEARNNMLHTLRYATKHYYYINSEKKMRPLLPIQRKSRSIEDKEWSAEELVQAKRDALYHQTADIQYQNQNKEQKVDCLATSAGILHIFSESINMDSTGKDLKSKHICTIDLMTQHYAYKIPQESTKSTHTFVIDLSPMQQKKIKVNQLHLECRNKELAGWLHYLRPVCQATLIDNQYQIIHLSTQCQGFNDPAIAIYLCIDRYKFNEMSYKGLADLLSNFFGTKVITLTQTQKDNNITQETSPIHWQDSQNHSFAITLAKPLKKPLTTKKPIETKTTTCTVSTCKFYTKLAKGKKPKKKQWQDVLSHLQQEKHSQRPDCTLGQKCPILQKIEEAQKGHILPNLQERCHMFAYIHPVRLRSHAITMTTDQHVFAYATDFAKMNPILLANHHPYHQLPTMYHPQKGMTLLLQEAYKNGFLRFNKEAGRYVHYMTPCEDDFIATVAYFRHDHYHRKLGSPLNYPALVALRLYTCFSVLCADFRLSQMQGRFKKWQLLDRYLMEAIMALHQAENKENQALYSGLKNVQFDQEVKFGFLATYTSTSADKDVAKKFAKGQGMLMIITQEMREQFPHGNVSWISNFSDEEELLFARSADTGIFPALKWKGTIVNNNAKMQHVGFTPALLPPLIVAENQRCVLSANVLHRFSYIKLGKNATLTTTPYNPKTKQGGHLAIYCLDACVLEEGAHIDVSSCGYPGVPHGCPGKGQTGIYCAGGGSYRTLGQPGKCMVSQTLKKASHGWIYGMPQLQTTDKLPLGSAGGSMYYTEEKLHIAGATGGGALSLTIDGTLKIGQNAGFKANGQNADATTGGAGSGGTIVIDCKSTLAIEAQSGRHIMAQGGQSLGVYAMARGAGGDGSIMVYYKTHTIAMPNPLKKRKSNDSDHSEEHFAEKLAQEIEKDPLFPKEQVQYTLHPNTLGLWQPLGVSLFVPRHLPIIIHYWALQCNLSLGATIVYTIVLFEGSAQKTSTLPHQKTILQSIPNHVFVTIDHFYHMGKVATQQQQYPVAFAYHNKAIALYKKHPTANEPISLPMLYQALATTYEKQGDYEKATGYYQQAGQKPTSFQATSKIVQDAQKEEVQMDYIVSQGLSMYIPLQATDTAVDQNKEIKDYPFADFMDCFLGETLPNASIPYNDESDTKEDMPDTDIANNNPKHPNKFKHKPTSLPQKIQNKLKNSQLLLLQGASGAGKSLCGRYISQQYNQQKHKIPCLAIFISLPKMYAGKNLLVKGLIDKGLDIVTITNLQKRIDVRLFFILDGFDEIVAQYQRHNLPLNIAEHFGLRAWKNSRFMISCRSQVLNETQKQDYFGIIPEVHLLPFSAKQVKHYIEQFATNKTLNIAQWSAKEYQEKLAPFQGLTDMTREPFSLGLILNVLPRLTLMYSDTEQLSRAQIYTAFSDQWFERQIAKLQQHQTLDKTSATLQATFLEYCCDLALTMFQQDTQIANPHQDSDIWQRFFTQENQINLQTSPLRKVGKDSYMFIHKSYQEYFVAYRFIQELLGLPSNPSNWQADHFIGLSFNQKDNQTAFNKATPIIHFMIDYLHSQEKDTYKGLQKCLFNIIAFSKENEQVATIAANSATILAMADVKLRDLNWQGIRIPGANLDQAFLARTNFSGSDCRNVSLRQAYLENTIWNNAQVQGIDFGEYPYLQHTAGVNSVSWSPDGKKLASASSDNTVRIWDGTTGNVIKACTGHTDSVNSVSWSPDGKKLASASDDKTVRIWDGTTGNFIKACTGHTSYVRSVSWSPDGKKLASASYDKTVRIWDGTTGNVIKACTGHTGTVWSVSWSPDGKKLASASYDKTVRIWDGTTGNFIKACTGHTSSVISVSWSPDGKKLASASNDKTVRIWDGTTGNFIKACTGHTDYVISVSWSPDGKKLASASDDKTVRIWDGTTGNFIKACTGHTDYVKSVSWSPDGKKLASASDDKTVRIWDGTTGNFIKAYTGHTADVNSVSWSPDGKKLASASNDYTVRIWDGTTGNFIKACTGHTSYVKSVSWSPDGKKLASASYDKTVRIWDGTTGNFIKACTGHTDYVKSVSWSPDGKKLASASNDYTVRIWDGTTGNFIKACTGHTGTVVSVRWSPDGKKLSSASYDNTVRIWDGTTGNFIKACTGHTYSVNSVRWSPDGKKLASASSDKTVRIWDGTTGNFIKACTGHTDKVVCVRWSPDGKKLASASFDKTVRIWDGTTGNFIKACTGHTGTVVSVRWSPDGKKLASASSDKTVRIWDGTTGNFIKPCTGHTGTVWSVSWSVSWSPDGKKLASASSDKTVRIWDGTTGEILMMMGNAGLSLNKANFQRAIGLSNTHQKLIKQRDGICGDKNVAHDDEKKEEAEQKKVENKNVKQITNKIPANNDTWACEACTYLNTSHVMQCDICGTQRVLFAQHQKDKDENNTSSTKGEWACAMCTYLNTPNSIECEICFTKRPQK